MPRSILLTCLALAAAIVFYLAYSRSPKPISAPDGSAGGVMYRVTHSVAHDRAALARMHERLLAAAEAADRVGEGPGSIPEFGTNHPALIPAHRAKLDTLVDPVQRLVVHYQIATELLLAGKSREALEAFESLKPVLASLTMLPVEQRRREAFSLEGAIGIAALRLGEQENCIENHAASSCLFPIEPGGMHALQHGSRRAIEAFTKQLESNPGDLGPRWLLNLAYMTVGEYPARVPGKWLIPPSAFQSDYDIGRFRDVAAGTGLDAIGLAGGVILEDFDGDNDLDIMVSSWGLRDQLRFFQNEGPRGFVDRTTEAGLDGEWGGINLSHSDYNNDGLPDVFVHRGGWLGEVGLIPNSLLRNNGDGTFTDVTEAAGLLSVHPTHAAAWADFDNDGYVDLFVGNEDSGAGTHPVQLYHNNGDGTFRDIAADVGLGMRGMVKGAAWGDFNNDGRPDLYVSVYGKPNRLFQNLGRGEPGAWQFRDVAAEAGVEQPLLSFATWFWDYDNDGWLDIFVGGWDASPVSAAAAGYLGTPLLQGTPKLFRNRGNGTFEDVTTKARLDRVILAMGANFGDLDNDGFLDLYLGTGGPDLTSLVPNRMFRNDAGRSFQDVTTSGGFGHLQKGHGIAFGDLDNDGDQDVYTVIGGWFTGDVYQNALFENPGHSAHWIAIACEGVRSNRMGVGTRVTVRAATARGRREIFRTVSDGGSFGSSSLRLEIGLGDATAIESLEVRWPATGTAQIFRNVALDQFVRVQEGSDVLTAVPRTPFVLGGSASRGQPASHPSSHR